MTCNKCGNTLIAAEWSEYVSDGLVLVLRVGTQKIFLQQYRPLADMG